MKKALSFLVLLVSCLCAAQTPKTVTISGRITEDGTGEPLYMVSVIEKSSGQWGMSDADGKFEITGLSRGKHIFTVTSLGYEEQTLQYDLKNDLGGINIVLKVSSLTLDEVVVTAKEGGEITSSSKIMKQTIEHIQPSSLTDVMQLLPGSVTANPSLTSAGSLSIRDIGTNSANAAGTALIVDGASFSNDANMQMLSTGTAMGGNDANVASTAGAGVDSRQVSTDNIESVEIIRGIPSVVYGDLTSGAVVVKTKAGVTPWEMRVKMDPKLKQVFVGKGVKLGEKSGVVNFDLDYANAFDDVRTQASAYNRVNFQTGYSNNFGGKLTFNAKLRGNFSNATNASDPDLLLDEIARERDMGVKLNINGKWIVNKPWLTNVEYLAAGGVTSQLSQQKNYQGSAGYTPATASMQNGESLAFFTDPQYYSDVYVYGMPIDAQARITANQLGTYGKVTSKFLVGAEWKMQGNNGIGKVFGVDCPPSPGSSSAYRERSFSDIPFLHRYTAFAEENLKLPVGSTSLELQAGARFNSISAKGISTDGFSGIEPRFNARYNIIKRNTGLRELALRAGWGRSFKMPSMVHLYPEDAWKDMVSFSYNDFDANGYGIAVMTTKKVATTNSELKVQQSRNFETGMEFDFGKISGSLVFFDEYMTNGYGFATQFVPMEYNRYAYTWGKDGSPSSSPLGSGAFPVYSGGTLTSKGKDVPVIKDTTFMAYSRPVNNMVNKKWGVEFTLDIARIKPINTSINISGAYMNIKSCSSGLAGKLYGGTVQNRTYPYVGYYNGTSTMSNGSIKERLSTNIRFVTHLPQLGMVITTTAQMVFMDRTRYISEYDGDILPYYYDASGNRISGEQAINDTEHTKFISPAYIMDRTGAMIPFTQDMELDPAYEDLILSTNTTTYYLRQSYPFYGMLNIRLSKEIRKVATISFYANNFLNLRGRVVNSVTGYPADKNTPIYFGAEIKLTLK